MSLLLNEPSSGLIAYIFEDNSQAPQADGLPKSPFRNEHIEQMLGYLDPDMDYGLIGVQKEKKSIMKANVQRSGSPSKKMGLLQ
jgi:hypothetical protein